MSKTIGIYTSILTKPKKPENYILNSLA